MKVAFLGGGNMASALIGGMLARGFAPEDLSVLEVLAQSRDRLAIQYPGVHVAETPDARSAQAEAWVLAVKPQDMRKAVQPLAATARGCLFISIAAGIRTRDLSRWLGGTRRLVRCMPNTPALIGAGMTGLYAADGADADDRARAERILGAVGDTVWVPDEGLLDPVTALSGSGPAYVFWFIEQLAASGQALGLEAATASRLALQTVLGAAKLAAQSADPPGVLRERVTSKGGTTEAALAEFAKSDLAAGLRRALEAASRRGTELGEQLGTEAD
jgi:pyrroline-5-carboxylate reductase